MRRKGDLFYFLIIFQKILKILKIIENVLDNYESLEKLEPPEF